MEGGRHVRSVAGFAADFHLDHTVDTRYFRPRAHTSQRNHKWRTKPDTNKQKRCPTHAGYLDAVNDIGAGPQHHISAQERLGKCQAWGRRLEIQIGLFQQKRERRTTDN